MKLSSEHIETYKRDGVLPLGGLLDEATVTGAREHLEALRRANLMDNPSSEPDRTSFRRLNVCAHDDWFMQIVTHPNLLDAAEGLLGPNIQYFQDNIFYKPARNGSSTPWHQDNIWWQADPPNMVTIWIALDDVDDDNGAVRYIPASHKLLLEGTVDTQNPNGKDYKVLAPKQVDENRAVSFTLSPGEAVAHHCQTIHGAPPNSSDRARRGYTVHLMQAGLLKSCKPETHTILRGSMPPSE